MPTHASPPWKFRQHAADHAGKAVAEAVVAISQLELGVGDCLWIAVIHPPAPLPHRAPYESPFGVVAEGEDEEARVDRMFGGARARAIEEGQG